MRFRRVPCTFPFVRGAYDWSIVTVFTAQWSARIPHQQILVFLPLLFTPIASSLLVPRNKHTAHR
ncbi:hypothetical protein EV363DRAFT_1405011 [Boletus edulis]|nr:hypothetical protein EV363DRAFT_1405011 [Boletus edulis]